MVTAEQFQKLFPANREPEAWTAALNLIMPKWEITGGLRTAAFISQCGHESQGFTRVRENLNYSAEALTKTWPVRFPPTVAKQYARQPERIANRAYADRMGNGPEDSGDGWLHRGRGLIQLTGESMYRLFAAASGKAYYDEVTAYMETKEGAVESACWFWVKVKDLNPIADQGNVLTMTKKINGGTNGLDERKTLYAAARLVLGIAG